jgi:hypothetical protein
VVHAWFPGYRPAVNAGSTSQARFEDDASCLSAVSLSDALVADVALLL